MFVVLTTYFLRSASVTFGFRVTSLRREQTDAAMDVRASLDVVDDVRLQNVHQNQVTLATTSDSKVHSTPK